MIVRSVKAQMRMIQSHLFRDKEPSFRNIVLRTILKKMESKWTGDTENAFFRSDVIDRNRILRQPEYEASGKTSKNQYYILSVDVGRKACDTVICVFKVSPQPAGPSMKHLVNIYTLSDEHFGDQALKIKQLYYKFKARRIVIDGNGLTIYSSFKIF